MAKEKEKPIEDKLQERLNRWKSIYQNGCSDPFWSDGCNLNLIRNHISHYKKQIEELYPNSDYPEAYYQDTPPKVDNNYMANSRKLIGQAVKINIRTESIAEAAQEQLSLF
jgi:hypothetical protein